MPKLSKLEFCIDPPDAQSFVDQELGMFRSLKALKMRRLLQYTSIVEGAKRIISQSPKLNQLDLEFIDVSGGLCSKVELRSIIEFPPDTSLRLQRLTLSLSHTNFDNTCVRFMTSLTHLNLRTGAQLLSPSFWRTLSDEHLALLSLKVSSLTLPILEYLLSYSGAKEISIGFERYELHEDEEQLLCEQFFSLVVPRHCESLEGLFFSGEASGNWCFTQSHLESLRACRSLKFLDIIYHYSSTRSAHPQHAAVSLVCFLPFLRMSFDPVCSKRYFRFFQPNSLKFRTSR